MNAELALQKLKTDLAEFIRHWSRVAEHVKQKPLARMVIRDMILELKKVGDRN